LPAGTGRLAGTVVDAESGRGVRFAQVVLSGAAAHGRVLTDASGSFAFDKLAVGDYSLSVSKPGYLDTEYGQARPGTNTSGKRISLRDREQVDRLVVPLSHGGAIAGVVRDDQGEPLFRATVIASRWVTRHGVRTLERVGQTDTDERGNYRISLLPPREYVVSARPADDTIPEATEGAHPYGFAPVYYTGATSARAASSIALGLGETRSNVDLSLPLVPLGKVAGTVVDAAGRHVAGMSVTLTSAGVSEEDLQQHASTEANGRFAFDRVIPGSYEVSANPLAGNDVVKVAIGRAIHFRDVNLTYEVAIEGSRDKKARFEGAELVKAEISPDESSGSAARGSASADVSVAAGAASELTLTLEPPRVVHGRIVFEGQSVQPRLNQLHLNLEGVAWPGGRSSAKVADDGSFVVEDVPAGRYSVEVAGLSPPWNVASAMLAATDALDAFLEIPRGRDVHGLVVTVRDRSTELSGTVSDQSSQSATDRVVVAFPSDEQLWSVGHRRIQSSTIGTTGQFSFATLPPGSYRLAVVDGAEPDEWLDPQFLRRLLPASVLVTLEEGERKVQNLRVK
jgi:carboxypeptidase family protein